MKSSLVLVFLLSCLFASAQYPAVSFRNVNLNEGLSQSCVVDIAFDAKGFVWLATQDGLNRYDGKDFLVLDKRFDDITNGSYTRLGKMVQGEDHSLWIIAKGGRLEKFNLVNNTFQPVHIYSGNQQQAVTCMLVEKDGKLWVGTESGKLLLYDSKTSKTIREINLPVTLHPAINALFKDKQQRLWILGSTIAYVENDKVHNCPVEMENYMAEMLYSCLVEDRAGNLWLGSLGRGLFMKKQNELYFRQVKGTKAASIPSDLVIEALLCDDSERIWMGTYGNGLFVLDRKGKKLNQFVNDKRNPASIAFNDILSIKKDKNKGIWLGTDGGGLSYFNENRNNFVVFNNQTVPENVEIALVRSVTSDKSGNLWAGTTNKGLTRINYVKSQYKTWQLLSYKKDIYNPDRIVSLFNDKDDVLWVGTQGNGLILFDVKKEKIIKWFHPGADSGWKIPDGTVWRIYPDKRDRIWIGTGSSGLCLVDKKIGVIGQYKPDKEKITDAIRDIVVLDESTLCIAFEKTGVRLFNTVTRSFDTIRSKDLQAFFNTETNIKCLYYKDSVLWIGTGGRGIFTYNRLNGKTRMVTEKDGLPNNTVYGILPDRQGYLWASTNKGLSRFSPDVLKNNAGTSLFTNYTAAQGLQSNEFNTGAYYGTPGGLLLFGGINGLNLFNPASLKVENRMIPVVFTKISIDNEPAEGDTAAAFKKVVHLDYQNHSVAFNFAALDFFSSQQHHYYYKLQGYEKKWIDANQRNYVSYSNVPPGKYNLLVKYVRTDTKNAAVTVIGLEVKGPFWLKWWFIAMIIVLFMALVYGLYRYRIAQVFKLLQIRQRIATDLHDDIGSTLSNINILSELSKKSLQNPAQARTFLGRISEEVQASSQSLDDIIWSVNTQNDTWEETFSRMRRYAAEVFESSATEYTIKLDEQAGATKLNMEKRRDVFLIYKEILNNIHKHALATKVDIEVTLRQHQLVMFVRDNGKGFDKNEKTHRNGLKNLKSRVSRWKGSASIETGMEGTHIKIVI